MKTQLLLGRETDDWERHDLGSKRVPAVDKCFAILDSIIASREPLGVSEISRRLGLNKSTVFNIVRTLVDLEVLEHRPHSKLGIGTRLYVLGQAAGSKAELVRTVHSYLKTISFESMLSSFLVIRWGMYAVIVDKAQAATYVKVSYEIGTRLPLLVGATGRALLCQLSDEELEDIVRENEPLRLIPHARKDRISLRDAVMRVREEGFAADMGEHVDGVITLAVPINTHRADLQAAISAVGFKWQSRDGRMFLVSKLLKQIAEELDYRFSRVWTRAE